MNPDIAPLFNPGLERERIILSCPSNQSCS
jgi:hypothetical protein